MDDFLITVGTSWGQKTKWLVRECSEEPEARRKLTKYYEHHIHVELYAYRKKDILSGHYIHSVEMITNKDVIEVCDDFPPEE